MIKIIKEIGEIEKNDIQKIQVKIIEVGFENKRPALDIRLFVISDTTNEWIATKRGITLTYDEGKDLESLLQEGLKHLKGFENGDN